MYKEPLNFFEFLSNSKKFKITVLFATFIYVLIMVFIVVGIVKNNEKIVGLMKDRQTSEFNKTYFYITQHYKKLSKIFYKEMLEHDFLQKLYKAYENEYKTQNIIKELEDGLRKNYGFESFEVNIINKDKKLNLYDFDIINTIDGIYIVKSLFLNKKFLGNLEMKIKSTHIHKWVENLTDGHTYIVFTKSAIDKQRLNRFENSFIDDNLLHNKKSIFNIDTHHMDTNFDYNEFKQINLLLKEKIKNYKFEKDSIVEWVRIDQNIDKDIAVVFKPLSDENSKHIGYIINYIQDKEYTKYIKIYNISLMLFSVIILILYIFIIFILYQRENEQIRNKRLKSLVKDLKQAKSEINSKQLELLRINYNLEDRIQKSIDKQREKDKIMFQQSKLATMGEMIGNIAHQWRQPLNVLSLEIQDLKDAYEYNEIDKAYIEQIVDNSMKNIDYMSKTIDDFRKFFEPNKTKVSFDIVDCVNQVLDIINISFKKQDIKIQIKSEKKEYLSVGYPNEFKQVILNLINNSKDAFLENINKGIAQNKPLIEIEIYEDKNYNIINIKDNALGIPENILDRIFEPYFTTKSNNKGTGLGLYMSKMIIEENMQGILEAKNSDNGAIFTLKLKVDKI